MSKSKGKKSEIINEEPEWELDYSKTGLVIGLEIHCQLNTLKTKLFCSCDASYRGDDPNTHTCEVCMGLPGSLPVINEKAIESATKVAIGCHSKINEHQFFYRKNYYYPDMARNFQISQYNRGGGVPFASGGFVKISDKEGNSRDIEIDRMHLEDDPGKLTHLGSLKTSPYTLIDYNRCGVTLIELVTKPTMYNPKEARAFCNKYRTILDYANVCDVKMDGSFRVDANVSLEGTNRVEIKNIGSVKDVEKALVWEISRLKQYVKMGKEINQETRAWNGQETILLRSKEGEDDYRYFPEPDLVPFGVSKKQTDKIAASMPELPDDRIDRYVKDYDMTLYDANVLVLNKESSNFFEECVKNFSTAEQFKILLNWINNDVQGYMKDDDLSISDTKLTPKLFVSFLKLIEDKTISTKIAKKILPEVINGKDPKAIVKNQGMSQVSDDDVLGTFCQEAIDENQDIVKAIQKSPKVFNALFGKVMQKARGKANVEKVREILAKKIGFDLSKL